MKIDDYLKKQKLSKLEFSQICGVEWSAFYKGCNSKFISLWLAMRINEASSGKIRYQDMLGKRPASIKRRKRL